MNAVSPTLRVNGALVGLLVALVCLSLMLGPVALDLSTIMQALWPLSGSDAADIVQQRAETIIQEIRLPRTVLALVVGAALGGAGAALQGLLRNPLAEPGLLGVSASAGFGAVLCLYLGLAYINPWLLPLSAMTGAALATALLHILTRRGASKLALILAGIALSSLAAALTSLTINFARSPHDVQDIVLWLLGSLAGSSVEELLLCAPFVALGLALLLASGRALDALTLGEEEAASLGIRLDRLQLQIILGCALCVGASVAVSGTIGFVGLVVPHLLRGRVGGHPSRLLLSSMLGGAALLLAADTLTRLGAAQGELMLGVVTALLGAPFFFALVLRHAHRGLV